MGQEEKYCLMAAILNWLAEQAAGILAYEALNPGYVRTLEEQQIISAAWRYANIQEVVG